jgi:hypothetical protein
MSSGVLVVICIVLITSGYENVFTCLFAIIVSFWWTIGASLFYWVSLFIFSMLYTKNLLRKLRKCFRDPPAVQ